MEDINSFSALGTAAAYGAVTWWSATGLILFLDRLPRRTFPFSLLAATLVAAGALYGLSGSRTDVSMAGAYVAFTSSILVWGWLEMAFLMGFVMGPRRHACPAHCGGWRHFGHAIQAILHHEIAIMIAAAAVFATTWGGANRVGWWTFVILWVMRQSAKLNLFLGVPNLGEQFLPEHLQYLRSFFRRRPMNFLLPISITAATIATALLLQQAFDDGASSFDAVSLTLLATLLGLAVLEHWFMVLPVPTEMLWRWSMQRRATAADLDVHPGTPAAAATVPAADGLPHE